MPPRFSASHFAYRGMVDTEFASQLDLGSSILECAPNKPNRRFIEHRPPMCGADRPFVFVDRIRRVVSSCAEKKVLRVHASRTITPVKDAQSTRNRPIMKFPRKPMSQFFSANLTF